MMRRLLLLAALCPLWLGAQAPQVPDTTVFKDTRTAFNAALTSLYNTLNTSLGLKAPIASPVFTGQPTIPDFTLAGHTHQNAAGGGTLDAAAIAAGVLSISRIPTGTSSSTVALGNHTHSGVYEPVDATILRQANLAGSGSAVTPARSDHTHTGVYEPSVTGGLVTQYWSGLKTWRDFATDAISAVTWSTITGKPSSFTPSAHASTHGSGGADAVTLAESQVTNLVSDLAAKAASNASTTVNGVACALGSTCTVSASGGATTAAGGTATNPTFACGLVAVQEFTMTLSANVATSTVSGCSTGTAVIFHLTQNGSGSPSWTFNAPTNSVGFGSVAACTGTQTYHQAFTFDGTNLISAAPGYCTGSGSGGGLIVLPGSSGGVTTITPDTTATVTLTGPNHSGTIATQAGAETLSNKTVDTATNTVKVAGTAVTGAAGTGSKLVMAGSAGVPGNCPVWSASGIGDSGSPCAGGGASAVYTAIGSATANSTSATTLVGSLSGGSNQAIPAGLGVGAVQMIPFSGTYTVGSSYGGTLKLDLLIGGTAVATTGTFSLPATAVTAGGWSATCMLSIRTAGSTGTASVSCPISMAIAPTPVPTLATASFAIDTTTTNAVDLQATWSTATGSPSITGTQAVLLSFAAPSLAPFSNSYTWKATVTVDHTQVGAAGTVPIVLAGTFADLKTAINGGKVQATAGCGGLNITGPTDLIVTDDSAGTNIIGPEISEYAASTGAIKMWWKGTNLSTSTDKTYYIWYGNAGATSCPFTTSSIWTEYAAVYHLPDGSLLNLKDSTANANDQTNSGLTATTGKIGGGANGSGSSQFASKTTPTGLPTGANPWTVTAWGNPGTPAPDANYRGVMGYGPTVANQLVSMYDHNGDFGCTGGAGPVATGAWTNSTWKYMACSFDGSNIRLLVNGVLTTGPTAQAMNPSSTTLYLGTTQDGSTTSWAGKIDEVRIATSQLSTGRLLTEYNNMNNPAAGGFFASTVFGLRQ